MHCWTLGAALGVAVGAALSWSGSAWAADSEDAGGAVAAPRAASTDESSNEAAELEEPTAERRDGFTVGVLLAGAFGGASGYPNDASKIDREEYYTNTGVAWGGAGSVWIGAALTDWVTFGLGVTYGALFPSDQRVDSTAIELHMEAFPAWPLGGAWQELGLYLKTGAGFASVQLADGSDPLVDTGGAARIGFGMFYEGIRAWQISMGPAAGGDFIWSPSGFRPMGVVGWRTVLYAGP